MVLFRQWFDPEPVFGGEPFPTWKDVIRTNSNKLPQTTYVVTGGTTGIGLETCKALVAVGGRVVIGARSNTTNVCQQVMSEAHHGGSCETRMLDLMRLSSVVAFAESFREDERMGKGVNVMVLNAGQMELFGPYSTTSESPHLETIFSVNYLHQFALVQHMLTISRKSLRRVVYVTSYAPVLFATSTTKMSFRNLMLTKEQWCNWPPLKCPLEAYANSKVAGMIMTRQLSKRYPGLVAVSVHPGLISGKLGVPRVLPSDSWWVKTWAWVLEVGTTMWWSALPRVKSAEQGAANQVWATLSPEVDQHPGAYFERYTLGPRPPIPAVLDVELGEELWKESIKLIGEVTMPIKEEKQVVKEEEEKPSAATQQQEPPPPRIIETRHMKITFTKDGSGPTPKKGQMVTVHCTGFGKNGRLQEKFWSTKDPGEKEFTFQIGMKQVIRGWDEGVMHMRVGDAARIMVQPNYGYGIDGFKEWSILPDSTLLFEIEVLKIEDAGAVDKKPDVTQVLNTETTKATTTTTTDTTNETNNTVSKKPSDTREPISTTHLKVNWLKEGPPGPTPKKGQMVTVHCTGYGKNANLQEKFWSTRDPGQKEFTFQIGIGAVIRAWDEGVMHMRVGDVAHILSTPLYGYGMKGFPSWGIVPNSALLFEIEVLRIADVN